MNIRFVIPTGNIVNIKRDRFLTAAMGACWHEYDPARPVRKFSLTGYVCTKCGAFFSANNDFSTLEDFLKLYEWSKNDPELAEFVAQFKAKHFVRDDKGPARRKKFADGLYEILLAKGRKT